VINATDPTFNVSDQASSAFETKEFSWRLHIGTAQSQALGVVVTLGHVLSSIQLDVWSRQFRLVHPQVAYIVGALPLHRRTLAMPAIQSNNRDKRSQYARGNCSPAFRVPSSCTIMVARVTDQSRMLSHPSFWTSRCGLDHNQRHLSLRQQKES